MTTKAVTEQIVAKAATIEERFRGERVRIDTDSFNPQQAEDRISRWQRVVTTGNTDAFWSFLAFRGLTSDRVYEVLGSKPHASGQCLPPWAELLRSVFEESEEPDSQLSILDEESYFRQALRPLVRVGTRRLAKRLVALESAEGSILSRLESEALDDLHDSLLARLLLSSRQVLRNEIQAQFNDEERRLYAKLEMIPLSALRRCGQDVVCSLGRDKYAGFFLRYPVLGKLIAKTIDSWINAVVTLLERFNRDEDLLRRTFLSGRCTRLGQICNLSMDLSDPHDRGHTVCRLEFKSGFRLIYKPHSLALDSVFYGMLKWWNQTGCGLTLRIPVLLDRHSYGWSETVEARPCEDSGALERFYHRVGLLLGLLYLLRGTDIHAENVIARDEHPVVVDLECLLSPTARPLYAVPCHEDLESPEIHSVLSIGILPRWDCLQGGDVTLDPTFLGIDTTWSRSNLKEKLTTRSDQILDGFRRMYMHLVSNREWLRAPSGPLAAFSGQHIRVVIRRTDTYALVHRRATRPSALTDGINHSIELEILCRGQLYSSDQPLGWPVFLQEQAALMEMNVPYFGTNSDSTLLTTGVSKPVAHFFRRSGMTLVYERLSDMCNNDLKLQSNLLKASFLARLAGKELTPARASISLRTPEQLLDTTALSRREMLEAASEIARTIRENAVGNTDQTFHWFSLQRHPRANVVGVLPIGNSLYEGRCGIALFLAAMDCASRSEEHRALVDGSLKSLQRLLVAARSGSNIRFAKNVLLELGIGGGSGLGSIIYSLSRIGRFYTEQEYLEDARCAAGLTADEFIASYSRFDVLDGITGLMLGLLALYGESEETWVLERAVICGNRLLEGQISTGISRGAWSNDGERPLTGFSHGTAGISYGLLRLYEASKNPKYLVGAQEGIAYEQRQFDQHEVNWPDYREERRPSFMASWCHGAPGIGLARLGGLEVLETAKIISDIETAIRIILDRGVGPLDNLCCGTFGLIDILQTASSVMSHSEHALMAKKMATVVLARARRQGGYQLSDDLPPLAYDPSFFRGAAGIGYSLLRLAQPTKLPSVLLLS